METLFIGKNCIEVEKTDSTNSYLGNLTSSSTPELRSQPSLIALLSQEKGEKIVFEGTVVVAKHQEQGRGQRGSTWESEPGKNLTLSILLQPTFLRPDEQFQLNKAVSLGVLEFVHTPLHLPTHSGFLPWGESEERGGRVSIKWPNDIYIGTKKVAGILIENSVSGNSLQQSIVGIGINVNQEKFSAYLPNPTSLKLMTGKDFDLKECLERLCCCIEKRYLQLRPHPGLLPKGEGAIDWDYLKNLYRYREFADYKYKEDPVRAKITGVTKSGTLLLETESGGKLECDLKELRFC